MSPSRLLYNSMYVKYINAQAMICVVNDLCHFFY